MSIANILLAELINAGAEQSLGLILTAAWCPAGLTFFVAYLGLSLERLVDGFWSI
jgi:hypothetical protein